jgi:hypothetical protein
MNTHTSNGGARGGAAPQREKVSFSTNIPVLVQLEFDPPTEAREGRFGDQYMYFLAGNRIMFIEPELHAEIVKAGCGAGSEVAICKRELRNAGRKHIQWEVVTHQEEPAHEAPPPRQLVPSAQAPRAVVRGEKDRNFMAAALTEAIEACNLAGFDARPEDVRALAITIYIQAHGGKQK